jgi:hypothetical protein
VEKAVAAGSAAAVGYAGYFCEECSVRDAHVTYSRAVSWGAKLQVGLVQGEMVNAVCDG